MNVRTPESDMLAPVLAWLGHTRVLREQGTVLKEFGWNGRHVDLAVLTKSRRTFAYELKVGHTRRAFEQAALNAVAFDRSYVVLTHQPIAKNLSLARDLGLGLLMVNPPTGQVTRVLNARLQCIHPSVRRLLLDRLLGAA